MSCSVVSPDTNFFAVSSFASRSVASRTDQAGAIVSCCAAIARSILSPSTEYRLPSKYALERARPARTLIGCYFTSTRGMSGRRRSRGGSGGEFICEIYPGGRASRSIHTARAFQSVRFRQRFFPTEACASARRKASKSAQICCTLLSSRTLLTGSSLLEE